MLISPLQGVITPAQFTSLGVAKYGIRHTHSTDTITRLGSSVGKVANISPGYNDFNNIMPWAGMRRCNLSDTLTINAYFGDSTYKEDGSNGQVMVEVPAFYYSRVQVDSDNVETYISMLPLPGFKLHPWFYDVNGFTRNKAYISAYEGCVYDVSSPVAEVDTLTVTAACTTSGNITITLDNLATYTIAVTAGDSTSTVATKIAAVAMAGWTVSASTATVTFTCNSAGAKNIATFGAGTTGVTATVAVTTAGAGGYTTGDAQIANFTASTGDKLASIAGVKPCSGLTQSLTLPNSRILATNRGVGWQQQYFNAVSAIQMLLIVEYASLNSQTAIGQGVVNIPDVPNTANNSIITGGTSYLGNKSGRAVGADGLVSISYRGIENFWGNIWKWVDGFNIQNTSVFISKINGNFVSDTFTGNYIDSGMTLANVNGYMSKAGLNYNSDYGFLPSEALGTSSSYYANYYYLSGVGAFVGRLGGRWGDGAAAGAFGWALSSGSGARYRDVGARLCA